MERAKAELYRSFTQPNGEGGNLAAVVRHSGYTFAQMGDFANKIDLSETAFVERIADGTKLGTFNILYFTRDKSRVPLCGHASIAAGKDIFSIPKWANASPVSFYYLDSNKNTASTEVELGADGNIFYRHDIPKSTNAFDPSGALDSVLPSLSDEVDYDFTPLQQGDVGFVAVNETAFDAMPKHPDSALLKRILESKGLIGLHVFTLCNPESGVTARARNFAPVVGIPEESATGSDTAILTYALREQNLLGFNKTQKYIQGEAMDESHGVIYTELRGSEVWVGGNVVYLGNKKV